MVWFIVVFRGLVCEGCCFLQTGARRGVSLAAQKDGWKGSFNLAVRVLLFPLLFCAVRCRSDVCSSQGSILVELSIPRPQRGVSSSTAWCVVPHGHEK